MTTTSLFDFIYLLWETAQEYNYTDDQISRIIQHILKDNWMASRPNPPQEY